MLFVNITQASDHNDGIAIDTQFDSGRYEIAIESYKKSIQENPNNFTAWNNLGYALFVRNRNNLTESLSAFDRAISIDSNQAPPYRGKALILGGQAKYVEALDEINTSLSIDKYYFQAISTKADILSSIGKSDEANNLDKIVINITNLVIDKNPNYISAYSFKARSQSYLGSYENALATANEGLEINPNSLALINEKFRALNFLNRYNEALDAANKGLELDPNDASFWSDKGMVLFNLGRYEEALNTTNKALELDKYLADSWLIKGKILFIRDRYEEALTATDKALELLPNNANFWHIKSAILFKLKRYEEALTATNKALELDPKDSNSWYIKGGILANLERYEEALTATNKALELDPNDADAQNLKNLLTSKMKTTNSTSSVLIFIIILGAILYAGWHLSKWMSRHDKSGRPSQLVNNKDLEIKQSQETASGLFEERIINVQELSAEEYQRIKPFIKETKYGLINYSIFDSYEDAVNCQKPISLNGSTYKGEGTHIKDIVKLPDGRFAFVSPTIRQRAGITYGTFVKHEFKPSELKNLDIQRGYSVLSNNDIKFGIRLTNNSNFMIADADVILDYAKNLFSSKDSPLQNIGNITPTSARTATYILKPLGCIHNEQINGIITYKDHTGKKQTLHMRPKEVHCVCPFLKEKPMSEGEYGRLAASSEFVQEGISFKGIGVEEMAKFVGETCRHMLYKVKEYDLEGKRVIYLSGESLGEKAYYLLTAVIQEYKGLTQVLLRAHSDKKYGLNGFMNEMADSIRHLVGSVQSAKEIGIIENTQVINIIDSVVQRTNFNMGEGGAAQVNIRDSVVQRSKIGEKDK